MEFCILSPIAGLERYARLSKRHLLLPQIRSSVYEEFYKARRAEGDFLILDNGAYEGESDWSRLVDCIRLYNPQVCALPDYLLEPWEKTHHAAFTFLDQHYYDFPDTAWMYIPQAVAGDIMGYCDALTRAIEDPRIGWIGLSRALPLHISHDPLMRVNVADSLRKRWRGKIHALGMQKGSVTELGLLRSAGVASIDSNAPVWRGWCGYSLTTGRWQEIPVNYEAPLPDLNEGESSLILDNLEACGVNVDSIRGGSELRRDENAGGTVNLG